MRKGIRDIGDGAESLDWWEGRLEMWVRARRERNLRGEVFGHCKEGGGDGDGDGVENGEGWVG